MHSRGHLLVLCVLLGVTTATQHWQCPPSEILREKFGSFPHPTSCQMYLSCTADGNLIEKSCPVGEEFNHWKFRCDAPTSHGCSIRLEKKTTEQLPNCHNQADGRKFPTRNCNSFVICISGQPKLQSCDWGLLFNADLEVCDWAANVRCYETSGPPIGPAPDCKYQDGAYLPNIYDCNSFYVCQNNVPMLQRCDAALVFDPSIGTCNWPNQVNCVPEPLPDVDPFLPDCNGREWEYIAHPANCGAYYRCEHNRAVLYHCDEGLLFDPRLLTCNWAPQVVCFS
ncbi:chondroitin proteoglycan-2-like [Lutzomyia longipalpis]|uniref:Chitin-binding type-2 domain-containing protein n=2 Tax=Lutzomyia longipalpis TaxID=7200 RepID=A0A1B0CR82_LUTLO|nr:chondroitin proteoglycan-2-like [Lutzomyia longipalpis]